jgi:hypothetical protein
MIAMKQNRRECLDVVYRGCGVNEYTNSIAFRFGRFASIIALDYSIGRGKDSAGRRIIQGAKFFSWVSNFYNGEIVQMALKLVCK